MAIEDHVEGLKVDPRFGSQQQRIRTGETTGEQLGEGLHLITEGRATDGGFSEGTGWVVGARISQRTGTRDIRCAPPVVPYPGSALSAVHFQAASNGMPGFAHIEASCSGRSTRMCSAAISRGR